MFKGVVHVYVPKTAVKWSLQALIRSPVWDNSNFGNHVALDGERMVVAANAYGENLLHQPLVTRKLYINHLPHLILIFTLIQHLPALRTARHCTQ